jgi:hypothetical protein
MVWISKKHVGHLWEPVIKKRTQGRTSKKENYWEQGNIKVAIVRTSKKQKGTFLRTRKKRERNDTENK